MKLVKELWPNGMGWDLLDGDVEVALDPLGDLERLLDAVDSLREDLH